MPDVLPVAALELSYPNIIRVLAKTYDFAVHCIGILRELPLLGASSPHRNHG